VQDVASRLRLDTDTIEYLEDEHYERLPAPAFVRGYLRNYASLLRIAADPLIQAFNRRDLPAPSLRADIGQSRAVTANQMPVRVATYGILLCAFILTAVQLFGENSKAERTDAVAGAVAPPDHMAASPPGEKRDSPQGRSTSISSLPVEDNQASGQSEQPSSSLSSESPSSRINAGAASISPPVSDQEIAPSLPASVNPAVATDDSLPVGSPPIAEEKVAAGSATPVQDHLSMRFAHDSWVEVYDHEGARLYYSLVREGKTLTLTGIAPFRVLLGYAKDVAIEYNGLPFDHRSFIHPQGLARFSLGKPSQGPVAASDGTNAMAPASSQHRSTDRSSAVTRP
jgi:cytoskeleton protein RodZ